MAFHHGHQHLWCRPGRLHPSASQRPHGMENFLLIGLPAYGHLSLQRGVHNALLRKMETYTERVPMWQLVSCCLYWSLLLFPVPPSPLYRGSLVYYLCFAGNTTELTPISILKISASEAKHGQWVHRRPAGPNRSSEGINPASLEGSRGLVLSKP